MWTSKCSILEYSAKLGCNVENKIKIAQLCLCATAEDDLSRVNEQNVLSNYISNQKDFLKIEDINIEVLIDKMKYLNICFKEIDFSISLHSFVCES